MAKKKNKAKLPKRIAGVKIPKSLRKSNGLLVGLLATPHGREAAAAALSAAATALIGTPAGRHMAADAGNAATGAGSALASGLESVGHAAGLALRQAAQAIVPSLPDKEPPLATEVPAVSSTTEPSKKQRGVATAGPTSKH